MPSFREIRNPIYYFSKFFYLKMDNIMFEDEFLFSVQNSITYCT